jgi:hypothetical protein
LMYPLQSRLLTACGFTCGRAAVVVTLAGAAVAAWLAAVMPTLATAIIGATTSAHADRRLIDLHLSMRAHFRCRLR